MNENASFLLKYRRFAFALLALLGAAGSLVIIWPLLPGLLWAIVLSVLAHPLYKRLRGRFSPNGSAGITTFATIALIGIPLLLIGALLFAQVASFGSQLASHRPDPSQAWTIDEVVQTIDGSVQPVLQHFGIKDVNLYTSFLENRQQLGRSLGGYAIVALKSGGYAVFTLVVAFLTMFYLLRDGHKLLEPAIELIPLRREHAIGVLDRMRRTIDAVFVGVWLVAIVQGLIAGLAYWATGVPSPLVWTVATMVLCTIPLVGAPVVYVPMSLLLFAQGKPMQAAILLVCGFGIVSNADNVLRPYVIATRVELHPIAIFFSLLGGVLVIGPVGLMAGPVFLTLMLAVQDILREQIREEQESQELATG